MRQRLFEQPLFRFIDSCFVGRMLDSFDEWVNSIEGE